ncbi:hypothetical protein [Paraburkholderia antibiotica]|uniref:Uncharacterized protein n=1 Tax=Paraburkholderia antibiotica TaxID=2728839 RepID=A0A7Y0FG83_9BURK|nr:hypothetical protein [Paraburkholderia antibiotica]NML34921.1 hypothetical protein [Paraburkholderia antibiotica]
MRTDLKETTQLVIGLTYRQMLDWMAEDGVFCSPDKYARRLQEAQRLALAARNEANEKEKA